MSSVQTILNSRSPEEGEEYLKTTVVDLLHEVEVLKLQLEESRQEVSSLKQEIEVSQKKDGERIDTLIKTLATATKEDQQVLSPEKAKEMNAEEACLMTIATLTRKVEELSAANSELVHEQNQLSENVEDLECESEAKDVKIKALETQFKSINRTRQKVVQKLGLSGNDFSPEETDESSPTPKSSPGYLRMGSPRLSP